VAHPESLAALKPAETLLAAPVDRHQAMRTLEWNRTPGPPAPDPAGGTYADTFRIDLSFPAGFDPEVSAVSRIEGRRFPGVSASIAIAGHGDWSGRKVLRRHQVNGMT
jgi:hypothetical protein